LAQFSVTLKSSSRFIIIINVFCILDAVQLRGISSHGLQWFPHCVTKDAIAHLVTKWGINLFRAVIYPDADKQGYFGNPAWFDAYVANIVTWCRELGIYVIIDFHVMDHGNPNYYLSSQGASTGPAIDFWKKYAKLYKGESHVLYEIANEPNGNDVTWDVVRAYHNAVISAIRGIDPETIIIAGTPTWSQDIHLAFANLVNEPRNVMYTFHFYAASHGSLYSRVADYKDILPIFVSEWGLSEADGGGTADTDTARYFLDLFSSAGNPGGVVLSWTMWSWCDKAETSAILVAPACSSKIWTGNYISCPARYMENYFKTEAFGNKNVECINSHPSGQPSSRPSAEPTKSGPRPSRTPTMISTGQPTGKPTSQPSGCHFSSIPEDVDCSGFAAVHGKLRLNGAQLVDKENSK
jgi:endoglucanase